MSTFDTSIPALGSFGSPAPTASTSSTSGGGTFWDNFGSILAGVAPTIAAIKGNPAAVNNYYGTDPSNPRPNNTLFVFIGIVVVGAVLLFALKK